MNLKSTSKRLLNIILFLAICLTANSQTNVAITIDDVPNTRKFQVDNYQSILLNKLDSLNIPIAIFINEGLIYKTTAISKNFELLVNWVKKDYAILGNHTFSHSKYSTTGFDNFKIDIEKGEYITRELADKYNKKLQHFRFPYNDLGKDSTQHVRIDSFLEARKYISTPFTVESSDWMFNYVYEYYLSNENLQKAKEIGDLYVTTTMKYFHFFDSLSVQLYGRKINQIYLCHDNTLNADYLTEIVEKLKQENFNFIDLDEAIQDSVYQQTYQYYRKWGVSWFYRWIPTQKERVKWMKKEPSTSEIEALYNKLSKE